VNGVQVATRIERFEDLIAWQKARALTHSVYKAAQQGTFARDFGLSGQIQRAAVSVMSNVAEGLSGENEVNFISFFPRPKLRVRRFARSSMSRLM